MKKLFNWIWAKPKKEPQTWTIAHNGWEAGARRYDDMIAKLDREVG